MTIDQALATPTPPAAVEPSADAGRAGPPAAPAPERPAGAGDVPPTAVFEAAQAIPRALQIAGSIVAPTTLLTALLYYFGLLYAIAYYRYFGVNYTILNVPREGYLILSVSTAILPMALIAAAALIALWLYQLPLDRLSGTPREVTRRMVTPLVGGAGLLLVGGATADALFGAAMFPSRLLEARGVSLALGVVLLAYAGRLRRTLSPPRRGHTTGKVPVALTVAKWGRRPALVLARSEPLRLEFVVATRPSPAC